MTAVVRAQGLVRRHPAGGPTILDGIDLEVGPGEWLAIFGPSGGGKTTLLSLIGALDVEFEGELHVLGRDPRRLVERERARLRNRSVGFVFQSFHLIDGWSVQENVELPLRLGAEPEPDPRRVERVLTAVGLASREAALVRGLSGGERQRVAIARALVQGPGLLLADEPTGNLDRATASRILDLFQRARDDAPELSIIIATHDERVAARADRCLELDSGLLRERSSPS